VEPGIGADFAHGAGTLVGAYGALKSGSNTKKAYNMAAEAALADAEYENKILKQNSQNAKGAAQRGAIEQDRQAKLAMSRAVAVAAGSGAGASDPTVTKLVGDLAARGKYNALTALYQGDSEAQYYENVMTANTHNAKANAAGYKFRGKASSGMDEAIGTLLSGASGFLQKYGEDEGDDSAGLAPGVGRWNPPSGVSPRNPYSFTGYIS
jgi:hypothetical protein